MEYETIDVIIHPDGRVELKVQGVKGDGCTAITAELLRILGGDQEQELTPEYFEQAIDDQFRLQQGG